MKKIIAFTICLTLVVPATFAGKSDARADFALSQLARWGDLTLVGPISRSGPVVLYIKDIHLNADVQSNIQKAIEVLGRSGRIGTLALEGGFGPIDLREFQNHPNQSAVKRAAMCFLKQKYIQGPIAAALTAGRTGFQIQGIDDRTAYYANVEAYRQATKQLPIAQKELWQWKRELDAKRSAQKTDEQDALGNEADQWRLTKKLIEFTLTKEEWHKLRKGRVSCRAFEQFYEEAERRDEKMAENLRPFLTRGKMIVLVTGGFHASGIEQTLKELKCTVIQFVPRMKSTGALAGSDYLNVLKEPKTPLQNLLFRKSLFLPPEVWPEEMSIAMKLGVQAIENAAGVASRTVGNANVTAKVSGDTIRFFIERAKEIRNTAEKVSGIDAYRKVLTLLIEVGALPGKGSNDAVVSFLNGGDLLLAEQMPVLAIDRHGFSLNGLIQEFEDVSGFDESSVRTNFKDPGPINFEEADRIVLAITNLKSQGLNPRFLLFKNTEAFFMKNREADGLPVGSSQKTYQQTLEEIFDRAVADDATIILHEDLMHGGSSITQRVLAERGFINVTSSLIPDEAQRSLYEELEHVPFFKLPTSSLNVPLMGRIRIYRKKKIPQNNAPVDKISSQSDSDDDDSGHYVPEALAKLMRTYLPSESRNRAAMAILYRFDEINSPARQKTFLDAVAVVDQEIAAKIELACQSKGQAGKERSRDNQLQRLMSDAKAILTSDRVGTLPVSLPNTVNVLTTHGFMKQTEMKSKNVTAPSLGKQEKYRLADIARETGLDKLPGYKQMLLRLISSRTLPYDRRTDSIFLGDALKIGRLLNALNKDEYTLAEVIALADATVDDTTARQLYDSLLEEKFKAPDILAKNRTLQKTDAFALAFQLTVIENFKDPKPYRDVLQAIGWPETAYSLHTFFRIFPSHRQNGDIVWVRLGKAVRVNKESAKALFEETLAEVAKESNRIGQEFVLLSQAFKEIGKKLTWHNLKLRLKNKGLAKDVRIIGSLHFITRRAVERLRQSGTRSDLSSPFAKKVQSDNRAKKSAEQSA